jgi:hypothetical protein
MVRKTEPRRILTLGRHLEYLYLQLLNEMSHGLSDGRVFIPENDYYRPLLSAKRLDLIELPSK